MVDERGVRRALLSGANLLQLLHLLGVVPAAEHGECTLTFELDCGVIGTLRLERGQFNLPRVVIGNIARGVASLFVPYRRLSSCKSKSRE